MTDKEKKLLEKIQKAMASLINADYALLVAQLDKESALKRIEELYTESLELDEE